MAARHHQSSITITDELHELVICDICLEPYDNKTRRPKFLECFHTFCSQCLISLVGNGQDNPRTILCPNCRHPTHLPKNGVDGMQTNFYIEKLKLIPATTDQTKAVSNTGGCHKHHDQPKSFFCDTCRIAVCRDCTVVDHQKADGHSIVNFTDAVAAQRHMLQGHLNAGLDTKKSIQRTVRHIESEMTKLDVCRDSVVKDLRSVMHSAHRKLMDGEQQITAIILQQYDVQQGALRDKQLQIQQANKLLDKRINQSETLVKTGDIDQMIHINEQFEKTLEITKSGFATFDTEKEYLPSNMISGSTPLNDVLSRFVKQFFKSFMPANIVLKNNKVTAGFESVLALKPLNNEGNMVPIVASFLSINITDPCGRMLPVTLNTTDPELTVSFAPQRSGRHDIVVMYLGQNLMSEQTHISVESNNPVLTFGGPGNGHGTFNSPRGITIDNKNCLYVTDTGNGLIQKFSAEGEFLSQFQVHGNGHNRDFSVFNVVLDLDKELIMCTETHIPEEKNDHNEGNNMLLFNHEGDLQYTYTLENTSRPLTIAMNSRGNVLLSDVKEKCVIEVDGDGNFLRRMGDFSYPGFICTNDDDTIIVPDAYDDCIYLYTPDGTIRHKFGTSGSGNGQLKFPIAVITDGEYILVAEGSNNRVQVFRYDCTSVSMIESTADPLHEPRGLAVTGDGHVYVVDRNNHCVKKYKYKDTS